MSGPSDPKSPIFDVEISDEDIYEAMKDIPGYLDITLGDLKEIYFHAYRRALERIACSVRAADLMTTKVHCVRRATPLKEVVEIMAQNAISGVPVVEEDGSVVGVISEKDFLSHMGAEEPKSLMGVIAECLQNKGCLAVTIRAQRAEDLMTSPAITVREDTILIEISNKFIEKKINRVPVVDQQGKLLGIVSRADIVRASLRA
jgi:CBS domain-containing membrane protein